MRGRARPRDEDETRGGGLRGDGPPGAAARAPDAALPRPHEVREGREVRPRDRRPLRADLVPRRAVPLPRRPRRARDAVPRPALARNRDGGGRPEAHRRQTPAGKLRRAVRGGGRAPARAADPRAGPARGCTAVPEAPLVLGGERPLLETVEPDDELRDALLRRPQGRAAPPVQRDTLLERAQRLVQAHGPPLQRLHLRLQGLEVRLEVRHRRFVCTTRHSTSPSWSMTRRGSPAARPATVATTCSPLSAIANPRRRVVRGLRASSLPRIAARVWRRSWRKRRTSSSPVSAAANRCRTPSSLAVRIWGVSAPPSPSARCCASRSRRRTSRRRSPPKFFTDDSSPAASGTASSAAALGVGARTSAAIPAIVTSVSWPTAATTGTREAAIARASPSSLNAHRSSEDPPPRTRRITSTPPRSLSLLIPAARLAGAASPCTTAAERTTRATG